MRSQSEVSNTKDTLVSSVAALQGPGRYLNLRYLRFSEEACGGHPSVKNVQ